MGNDIKGKKKANLKINPYIIFIVTGIIIYIILSTSVMGKKYELQVGDIAKNDIKAPKDVEDKVTTQKNIEEQLNHVQDIYTYNPDVKVQAADNINRLFDMVTTINKTTVGSLVTNESAEKADENEKKLRDEKIQKLKKDSPIKELNEEQYGVLIDLNSVELEKLHNDLVKIVNDLYDTIPIYDGKSEDVAKAQAQIVSEFSNKPYKESIINLGIAIGDTQIKTTYFLDEEKTEEARQNAIKNVTPVMYKKDQTIVAEGQPVTEAQISVLNELGLLNSDGITNLYLHISVATLIIVILGLQWNYIRKKHNKLFRDSSKLILINLITVLAVGISRSIMPASPYMIPFACTSILMAILIGEKISIIVSVLNIAFISIVVSFSPHIMLIALLNAVMAPIIINKVQQRNDILYSSVKIGVINMVFTLGTGYFLSADIVSILMKSLMVGAATLISGILAIGILPILENLFNIVTNMKLLELANPNHPLMRRLLLEAPGTYHHSVLVANLAEMAAEKVGANPIMARVAAYYHDVGKLERPYYFKENQVGGVNPHDKMSPSLSAAVILSHVDDGVKLGEKYNLPKDLIAVIREHHGTSLAKYFYITMRNESDNPDEVNENDYKYKGPAPTSKESSIVMMADGVEASVRSIQNPTNEKIREMVDNIFKSRIDENQMINSELTFKDIEMIKESFLKVLKGIYHERIEYPKDKVQMEKKTTKEFLEGRKSNDEDMKIYNKMSFKRVQKEKR